MSVEPLDRLLAPPAGSEAAGERQPANLHELPVEAVRNAPEEVRERLLLRLF